MQTRTLIAVLLAIGWWMQPACAQTGEPEADTPRTGAQAQPGKGPASQAAQPTPPSAGPASQQLARFEAFYRQLAAARAEYTSSVRLKAAGMNMRTRHRLAMERPNRLAIVTTDGLSGGDVISDGEHLYMAIGVVKRYTLGEAPESFDAWLDQHRTGRTPIPAPGIELIMQLLTDEPVARLLGDPAQAEIAGPEPVGGVPCRQISGRSSGYSISLWIEDGDQPWLRRMRVTSAGDEQSGAPAVEMDLAFDSWSAEAPDDDIFAIAPPADFTRAESLYPDAKQRAAGSPPRARPGGPSPSGERGLAPAFELELLGGGRLELSKHVGKDVIVLDFWATWCRPCVMALPVVSEAALSLKDRGVAFYTVNLREPQNKVAAFMQARSWDFPVALDATGKVAQMYGVQGIPHTVVIDRSGKIAHVHVGYSPQVGQQLKAELEALLD